MYASHTASNPLVNFFGCTYGECRVGLIDGDGLEGWSLPEETRIVKADSESGKVEGVGEVTQVYQRGVKGGGTIDLNKATTEGVLVYGDDNGVGDYNFEMCGGCRRNVCC